MSETHFVSFKLDSSVKSHTFDPDIEIGSADTSGIATKYGLALRQVLLGHDSEKGDVNVVQIEAAGISGESIQAPIAILENGKEWTSKMDFTFPDAPVVFTLISGKGPVYVQGNAYIQVEDEGDDGGEEEDDEDDVSESELEHMKLLNEKLTKTLSKKRKPADRADNDIDLEELDGPTTNGKSRKLSNEEKKSPRKSK